MHTYTVHVCIYHTHTHTHRSHVVTCIVCASVSTTDKLRTFGSHEGE